MVLLLLLMFLIISIKLFLVNREKAENYSPLLSFALYSYLKHYLSYRLNNYHQNRDCTDLLIVE
jgi:hypothetical protein